MSWLFSTIYRPHCQGIGFLVFVKPVRWQCVFFSLYINHHFAFPPLVFTLHIVDSRVTIRYILHHTAPHPVSWVHMSMCFAQPIRDRYFLDNIIRVHERCLLWDRCHRCVVNIFHIGCSYDLKLLFGNPENVLHSFWWLQLWFLYSEFK